MWAVYFWRKFERLENKRFLARRKDRLFGEASAMTDGFAFISNLNHLHLLTGVDLNFK